MSAMLRVNGRFYVEATYCWSGKPEKASTFAPETAINVAKFWRKAAMWLCGVRCVDVEVVGLDGSIIEGRDEARIAEVDRIEAEIEARRRGIEDRAQKAKDRA